jgi:hypothetical protein
LFFLLIATLVLFFKQPNLVGVQALLPQIRPYLTWFSLVFLQFWLFLLNRLWTPIRGSLQTVIPSDQAHEHHPAGLITKISMLTIGITYILLQTKSFLVVRSVAILGDGNEYILPHVNLKFTDLGFWMWAKPWVTLAIYKLTGYSLEWIEFLQITVSVFAWCLLAWNIALGIRKQWVKVIAFSTILGFSLTEPIQVWNHVALSESFSISILILILANSVSLTHVWRPYKAISLCLLFFLWANTREANVYIALLLAIGLFLFGLRYKSHRYTWAIVVCILVAAAIQIHLSSLKSIPRWVIPLGNVITQRILPEQEYRNYFEDHGMPLSPEVMSLSGQWIYSNNLAFFDDPRLRGFQKWFYSSGPTTYGKFLIQNPSYTIQSPLENSHQLFVPLADLDNHRNSRYTPTLPLLIRELFFPLEWFWLYLWIALPILGGLLILMKWNARRSYIVILAFFLLSLPHFYLAWHGDSAEVGRHSIQANIQFRLSIIILLFYYLEAESLAFTSRLKGESKNTQRNLHI